MQNGYITEDDNLYRQIRRNFYNAIKEGNTDTLIDCMKQFYSTIPYDIQDKMKVEQAYQLSIVILLMYLGFDVHAETRTNKGRIDILIKAPNAFVKRKMVHFLKKGGADEKLYN